MEGEDHNPMPLTLAFTGKVNGDAIEGEMGIGPMGSFRSGIAGVRYSRHCERSEAIQPDKWIASSP